MITVIMAISFPDFTPVRADEIKEGMVVGRNDLFPVFITQVGYLPLSNRYVFGIQEVNWVEDGFKPVVGSKIYQSYVYKSHILFQLYE